MKRKTIRFWLPNKCSGRATERSRRRDGLHRQCAAFFAHVAWRLPKALLKCLAPGRGINLRQPARSPSHSTVSSSPIVR